MAEQGDIIVITGGNGFVGQHIIKLLHEYCHKEIKQIRVFDVEPYCQKLDYHPTIPIKSIQGDICNLQDFTKAVKGADCVIHVAGVISFGTNPNMKAMKAVNVDGTNIVIEACLMNNVRRVVHTSSVDAVLPRKDCVDVDEDSLPYPLESEAAMPGYGPTKKEAEKLVIHGHGRPLADGMYGELDVLSLVATALKRVENRKCVTLTLVSPAKEACVHEMAYVGNVAWAHVCALRALRDKPDVCGGKAYFITDDTPKQNFSEHHTTFEHEMGYNRGTDFQIPFTVTYFIVMFLQILTMLLKPVKAINIPINLEIMELMGRSCTFNRTKATNKLGYHPLFSYEESKKQSMEYYKHMKK